MKKKDYHLLISLVLLNLVENRRKNKRVTINMTLVKFVEFSAKHIDALYLFFGNQKSKYEPVETVIPCEERVNKDIHLCMDERLYENIKSKHSKHNNYSLAQFVRRCIYFALLGLEKYGTLEEFSTVLERLKKKHGKNLVKKVLGKSDLVKRYLVALGHPCLPNMQHILCLGKIRQLEEITFFKMWIIAEFIKNLDLLL